MRKMRDIKEELSFNFFLHVCCELVSQLFVCLALCAFIVQLETELMLHMFKWKFELGEYNVKVINREMSSHFRISVFDRTSLGSLYRVKAELCTAD